MQLQHPPMLMASLRSVINEASVQETGVGQTPPSPTPYPIQTLCLPLPCARQALPALPHPSQTLYRSLRLSPAFLSSIFLTSLTAGSLVRLVLSELGPQTPPPSHPSLSLTHRASSNLDPNEGVQSQFRAEKEKTEGQPSGSGVRG